MTDSSSPDNKPKPKVPRAVSALIEQAFKEHAPVLDLSGYNLTEIPESLTQLTWLEELYLSNNQLTSLPESLGQLSQIEVLDIAHNQLTSLPESFGQLNQLQSLLIFNNQLTSLPEWLGQLVKLIALHVDRNQLTSLPESLGQLVNLRALRVEGNQLTSLPESLGQLILLEALVAFDNKLMSLPKGLRHLRLLNQIFLHGNDKLKLPAELLGPSYDDVVNKHVQPANPADILEYYFRVQEDVGKRPLNEAKLILVGRGAVGKTSLVNKLVYNRFEPNEKKTEGIRITEWPLVLNGHENVRLNVWDFGGQEIMHATHQFFLTQRSIYLLVLNGREGGEDADAEYWLKLIESFGGGSPVILVMNKIKEHPFDVNRRALEQKYPIREFIKTDCEDDTGIPALRKSIERETDRLEHLRHPFPASWFSIKEQLAGMKSNYLNFEAYRRFCAEHGETDQEAQNALAGYLHNLGIVLNFKDDARLQDTHVLNPHWMTNGIYKILNSQKLAEQKGEIRLGDLSEILDPIEYPPEMRRFILDLMKKFDLCFSFPDDDTHYLIPELLDKQEPPDTAEFKPEECLNFQYNYPVLPEGLLPRFIVRTRVLSEASPRWRTGVILKFEGCSALVKADVQDKKVFISISGPPENRRRLLAVIRSDFERIHYDIRNLRPQEMIPVPSYPDVVVDYEDLILWETDIRQTYSVRAGGRILNLSVSDLLNGVSLKGERRDKRSMETHREAPRLFISYSHKDDSLRNELQTQLKLLQRERIIEAWDDRRISAGDEWKQQLDDNLERADIILLLVSADFIASDYCYEQEMRRALELHDQGQARVIPVIVRDVNWKNASFAKLQVLPADGVPVNKWADKDSAWRHVAEEIEKVARAMTPKSRRWR